MRRDWMTDHYLDLLRRDPHAAPPPGMDDETAALVRALVQAERIPPHVELSHSAQAHLWEDALRKHRQSKENPNMTTMSLPRRASHEFTRPMIYAFAVLIAVIFTVVLLTQRGGNNPLPPNGNDSAPPALAGNDQGRQDSTATPLPTTVPPDRTTLTSPVQPAQAQATIDALHAQIAELQAALAAVQANMPTVPPPDLDPAQANAVNPTATPFPMTGEIRPPNIQNVPGADTALGSAILSLIERRLPIETTLNTVGDGAVIALSGTLVQQLEANVFRLSDWTGDVRIRLDPDAAISLAAGMDIVIAGRLSLTEAYPVVDVFALQTGDGTLYTINLVDVPPTSTPIPANLSLQLGLLSLEDVITVYDSVQALKDEGHEGALVAVSGRLVGSGTNEFQLTDATGSITLRTSATTRFVFSFGSDAFVIGVLDRSVPQFAIDGLVVSDPVPEGGAVLEIDMTATPIPTSTPSPAS